jgi:CYTH domain-containing protein
MGMEIERKFLVKDLTWKQAGQGTLYRQGYLCSDSQRTVRVRLAGDRAWLTIKGASEGISRSEYEYEIPCGDAIPMLDALCEKPLIEKTRYKVAMGALVWEIDEFLGENLGLIVAEIELASPEQEFERPAWLGAEVSHDRRYFNSRLVKHPFSGWGAAAAQGEL